MGLGVAAYALTYWGILATTVSPMGPHVNAALGIGFSALEGVTWPAFHEHLPSRRLLDARLVPNVPTLPG